MEMNDASVQELVDELLKRAKHTNGLSFMDEHSLYYLESVIREEQFRRWNNE